jgi:hypothetical protein
MWQYRVAATLAIAGIAGSLYVGDTIALVLLPVALIVLLAGIATGMIERMAHDAQHRGVPLDPHHLSRRPAPTRQPDRAEPSGHGSRIRS